VFKLSFLLEYPDLPKQTDEPETFLNPLTKEPVSENTLSIYEALWQKISDEKLELELSYFRPIVRSFDDGTIIDDGSDDYYRYLEFCEKIGNRMEVLGITRTDPVYSAFFFYLMR